MIAFDRPTDRREARRERLRIDQPNPELATLKVLVDGHDLSTIQLHDQIRSRHAVVNRAIRAGPVGLPSLLDPTSKHLPIDDDRPSCIRILNRVVTVDHTLVVVEIEPCAAEQCIIASATSEPVIPSIAYQQINLTPADQVISTTATEHEGTTILGIHSSHATRSRLHIPIAEYRKQRFNQLPFCVGKSVRVEVALKIEVVPLGIIQRGGHVSTIELEAARHVSE